MNTNLFKILFILHFNFFVSYREVFTNLNINNKTYYLKYKDKEYTFSINNSDKCEDNNLYIFNKEKKTCDMKLNLNLDNEVIKNWKSENKVDNKAERIIKYKDMQIILTKDEKLKYTFDIKDNLYKIYLPYRPIIRNTNYFIIHILKIITGIYLCFFGIKNFKLTIILISFLLSFEIIRILLINNYSEYDFYSNGVIFISMIFVSLFSFVISFLTYRFEKLKIFINSVFFSYIINNFFLMFIMIYFIENIISYYRIILLITFIIGIVFCIFLVNKDIIKSIIIYTSFMGSFFFIYNIKKLCSKDISIFENLKNLEEKQNVYFNFTLNNFSNLFIIVFFIMGILTQWLIKKRTFEKLTNSELTHISSN